MSHRILSIALGTLILVFLGALSAQLLQKERAEAQSNQPPVIQAIGDKTMREGDTLVIPFTAAGKDANVSDPNNDRIDYFVERMVGGAAQALPSWMKFDVDPKTAERKVVLWPDLNAAGSYQLRFRAMDEFGAAATPQTVTVTVTNRTSTPAVMSITTGWFMPDAGSSVFPGSTYTINEGKGFLVVFDVADPEGDALTVRVDGMPNASLTRDTSNPNRYALQWITSNWPPGSHSDVGVYPTTITVTDAAGNTGTAAFTLDVQLLWGHQNEVVFVRPEVTAGGRREVKLNYFEYAVVSDSVTFGVESQLDWFGPIPLPSDMRYRYVLHTPDSNGNDQETPISGILTGPQTIQWDSRSLPDGTYAVSIDFVDGGTSRENDLSRFRERPLIVIVDNTPGAVTGPQWIPTHGSNGFRSFWSEAYAGVEWIRYSGQREEATSRPYPFQPAAPPASDPERQALLSSDKWFPETWIQTLDKRYDQDPGFFRLKEGHLVQGVASWEITMGSYDDDRYASRLFDYDGGRNNVTVAPKTSLRPIPGANPGFIGIDPAGRLLQIDPTSATQLVTTLAGYMTPSNVTPFYSYDYDLPQAELVTGQKILVGAFTDGIPWKSPTDLAFDPANPKLIYVTDRANSRIVLVDLRGPTPLISPFAGLAGSAGFVNGDRLAARFNYPRSIEFLDGKLYVTDTENSALRAIDLATGQVTTVVGPNANVPPVPDKFEVARNYNSWTWANASFDTTTLVYPHWVRRDSLGNLFVQEDGNETNVGTGNVRYVDLGNQTVRQVYRLGHSRNIDVDFRGLVGPRDHILTGSVGGGHDVWSISPDGSSVTQLTRNYAPTYWGNVGGYQEPVSLSGPYGEEPGTSYPIHMVIDDTEARFAHTSVYRSGLLVWRPIKQTDPSPAHDDKLYHLGQAVYYTGTVPEFAFVDERPSLAMLHGRHGHNWFGGNIKNFDDLAADYTDAELGAYIRSGMGGKVARSEITGKHLQALIYFIRLNSLQGKTQTINPATSRGNLRAAGLFPNDSRLPEIRNAQVVPVGRTNARVTWRTDEPTYGVVQYGRTGNYGLSSPMESGAAKKDHEIVLTDLPAGFESIHRFRIRSVDAAGNMTEQAGLRAAGAIVDTDPPAITNVQTTGITSNSATIAWSTDEPADSTVEYGTTTGYGKSKSDGRLVTSHSVSLTGLLPSTQYHFRVRSADPSGNAAVSGGNTFTTLQAPPNAGPTVSAGGDRTVTLPGTASLDGTVSDDGLPSPPGVVTVAWSKVSGPGTVTFGDSAKEDAVATFSLDGTYVLRLTGNDGAVSASDDVQVTVKPVPLKESKGLLGYWTFEGNVRDATAYGNDGVVTGNPTYIAGKKGQAVKLNAGDLINMGRPTLFEIEGPVTFAAWVNVKDVTGGVARIAGKARGNIGGQGGYSLTHAGGSPVFTWTTLQDWGGGTTVSSGPQNTNTWLHMAGTFDGTTNRIYIDGVLDASAPGAAPTDSPSYDFLLGSLGMSLDEVCLFDVSLTAAQVRELSTLAKDCGSVLGTPPPPPSESVCLQIPLKNRLREGKGDFAIAGTVEVRRPDGTIALSTIATPERDGTLRITDASLLGNLDATTSYTVSVKPRSHQRRVLRNVTTIKDGVCRSFPASVVGDFNGDGKLTLPDLVRTIRHYQKNDDAGVSEAYAEVRPTLATLIDLLRAALGKVEDE